MALSVTDPGPLTSEFLLSLILEMDIFGAQGCRTGLALLPEVRSFPPRLESLLSPPRVRSDGAPESPPDPHICYYVMNILSFFNGYFIVSALVYY